MLKGLVVASGVAFMCAGFATDAAAASKSERALLQRYASKEKCDSRGAPAWGRASMERWRRAQRRH